MKTVAKIDPEKEYEIAKQIILVAENQILEEKEINGLNHSVDNLMMATRILLEREERRRGPKKVPKENKKKGRRSGDTRDEVKKLPSERYPNAEIEEKIIEAKEIPSCPCCSEKMSPSGLYDVSEKLEVIPKKYFIVRSKRVKYNCSKCHAGIVNTPAPSSIIPNSNYGDSLVIDVSLSKYCDLIPIERYVQMAHREGLEGLPANSLIELTHHLAKFLVYLYLLLKQETQKSLIAFADETRHRMLEGDETSNWYLWGFFCPTSCFFDAHNTRSGDIAFNFLKESKAEFLLTDGYTGYSKAIKDLQEKTGRIVTQIFCNAHSFRYFREAGINWKEEVEAILALYSQIYSLEKERLSLQEKLSEENNLSFREKMLPLFEKIKAHCEEQKKLVMPESTLKKALFYFLSHYDGLILCTTNVKIPLDNNLSERELRAPVVGKKTWLGTHSKRGAMTNAIIFSIVQSCKINNVNPRDYVPWVVKRIHEKKEVLTPYQYKLSGFG